MISFIDCTRHSESPVSLHREDIEKSANWCLIEIPTNQVLFDVTKNIMPNLGVSLHKYFKVQVQSTLRCNVDC